MQLRAFRVQMFRGFRDSGWIEVSPLTVLVGKNESGKTSLLTALHKLNPFNPEPYNMAREWPRGFRDIRSESQVVCTARFELTHEEVSELCAITGRDSEQMEVEVTRDYAGHVEVYFGEGVYPDKLHPNDIDRILDRIPPIPEAVGEGFRQQARECEDEAKRLAHEGRFSELGQVATDHSQKLTAAVTPGNPQPINSNEMQFQNAYLDALRQVLEALTASPSIQAKAHEYVIGHLPTFVYMSDYRAFTGSAQLDLIQQRRQRNQLTEEDKTLLMIMHLSGLDLDSEVRKGSESDREQRQYDLDDASATLTREISERWHQKRYEVQYRADGQLFYTFVKDERDPSLIRLEERSKGFQWFFSFDLMFMHETQGTFKNSVILLDEPGLHLHPNAQRDLLRRMEAYAEDNTLIYTTHLPFMIDLRHPDRIRVLSETEEGIVVTADLTQTQPEAKFVLQAALGMSGSSSHLVAQRNVVVEGVNDYWIVTELSNLLQRSGENGLPDDIFITPAGGASEAAYIATFMIGQKLDVVVLLDSDRSGNEARDSLVKQWLTRYHNHPATVLSLGPVLGVADRDVMIEDLFPDTFYCDLVKQTYQKDLAAVGISSLTLRGNGPVTKRVESTFAEAGLKFNKGSVAKRLRASLSHMHDASSLPPETLNKAQCLIGALRKALAENDAGEGQ